MRQQRLHCREKPHGMRQRRVKFKCRLIHPLRMNRELKRFPQRLKHMDAYTTNLSAGRFIHSKQLFAEQRFLSRPRLKPDNKVKRQFASQPSIMQRIGKTAKKKPADDPRALGGTAWELRK